MGVCDVPVISTVRDVAGETAATVVAAPFDRLAQALGGAAGWLIEAMWSVFDTNTLALEIVDQLCIGLIQAAREMTWAAEAKKKGEVQTRTEVVPQVESLNLAHMG